MSYAVPTGFLAFLVLAATEKSREKDSPIADLQRARVAHAKAKAALKEAEKDLEEAQSKVQALIKEKGEELAALKSALTDEDEKPARKKRPVRRPKKKVEDNEKSEAPKDQKKEYALSELERQIAQKTAEERRAKREGDVQEAKELVATLEMRIPRKAKVWIGGKRKKGSGRERSFESPVLKSGEEHQFKVRITWRSQGVPQEVKRTVTVKAGETMILAVGKARVR